MNKNLFLNLLFVSILTLFTFGFSEAPPECTSGLVDEENSYSGNWDMHVGGCWTPPEPRTCVYCEYL